MTETIAYNHFWTDVDRQAAFMLSQSILSQTAAATEEKKQTTRRRRRRRQETTTADDFSNGLFWLCLAAKRQRNLDRIEERYWREQSEKEQK